MREAVCTENRTRSCSPRGGPAGGLGLIAGQSGLHVKGQCEVGWGRGHAQISILSCGNWGLRGNTCQGAAGGRPSQSCLTVWASSAGDGSQSTQEKEHGASLTVPREHWLFGEQNNLGDEAPNTPALLGGWPAVWLSPVLTSAFGLQFPYL